MRWVATLCPLKSRRPNDRGKEARRQGGKEAGAHGLGKSRCQRSFLGSVKMRRVARGFSCSSRFSIRLMVLWCRMRGWRLFSLTRRFLLVICMGSSVGLQVLCKNLP